MKLIIRKQIVGLDAYLPGETENFHMASMAAETRQGWVMLYVNQDGAILVQKLRADGCLDESSEGVLYHREGT